MDRVYFDHAATTALDPRVLEAMLPHLTSSWGNPSSIYREGQAARVALEQARAGVACVFNCSPAEVVFTSGGSEADNLAVRGVAAASTHRGRHIVTSAIEHHAVLHAAEQLERMGYEVTYLDVDAEGFVNPNRLREAVRPDTTLISVMYANNEIGAVQRLSDLLQAGRGANPGVPFHTDAVQAAAWLALDVQRLGVDLLSISAHKLGGPKGVGALFVRRGTPLMPQVVGGNQEANRRAGTENVAGAVGLAVALQLAQAEKEQRCSRLRELSRVLADGLAMIPGCHLTGPRDLGWRLPGLVSCYFEGLASEDLLIRLDMLGFAASSGSACTTGSLEPSHVLTALGIDERSARGSLRLSMGPETTPSDVERLLAALPAEVARLRELAAVIG